MYHLILFLLGFYFVIKVIIEDFPFLNNRIEVRCLFYKNNSFLLEFIYNYPLRGIICNSFNIFYTLKGVFE